MIIYKFIKLLFRPLSQKLSAGHFPLIIRHFLLGTFTLVTFALMPSCSKTAINDGPYFGNGFHNGWADQHSIVIWTRLTQNPEMNMDGQPFTPLTTKERETLDKLGNRDSIHRAQIPDSLTLADMEGACPGAVGEVMLRYFPSIDPDNLLKLPGHLLISKRTLPGNGDWTTSLRIQGTRLRFLPGGKIRGAYRIQLPVHSSPPLIQRPLTKSGFALLPVMILTAGTILKRGIRSILPCWPQYLTFTFIPEIWSITISLIHGP